MVKTCDVSAPPIGGIEKGTVTGAAVRRWTKTKVTSIFTLSFAPQVKYFWK